jgi:hypothetical protein
MGQGIDIARDYVEGLDPRFGFIAVGADATVTQQPDSSRCAVTARA